MHSDERGFLDAGRRLGGVRDRCRHPLATRVPPMLDRRTDHGGNRDGDDEELVTGIEREHLEKAPGRNQVDNQMLTARSQPCQTGYHRWAKRLVPVFACGALLVFCLASPLRADDDGQTVASPPVPRASPALPPWQQELKALSAMRIAAALSPDQPDASGKTPAQRLEAPYRQLAVKYPDQAEVQRACGDFFSDAGDGAQALGYWLRAQVLQPSDADLADTVGSAYLRAGNVRAAARQFQRAVDAQPDQPQYHSDLANTLYLFRHELLDPPSLPDAEAVLVRALEHFRLAAQLSPGNRKLAEAYAETFYLLAKPDWTQAISAWQTVLALSGDDSDFANSHLARVSLRMKRPQEAKAYLDRLRRPDFDSLQIKLRAQAKKLENPPAEK